MTGPLPYEQELQKHWNDLPLPDIDMAWNDMRRRLEDDEDRVPIIPWWRSCAGLMLFGLIAVVIAWVTIKPQHWFSEKKKAGTTVSGNTSSVETNGPSGKSRRVVGHDSATSPSQNSSSNETSEKDSVNIHPSKPIQPVQGDSISRKISSPFKDTVHYQVRTTGKDKKVKGSNPNHSRTRKVKPVSNQSADSLPEKTKKTIDPKDQVVVASGIDTVGKRISKASSTKDSAGATKVDSIATSKNETGSKKDSTRKKKNDWVWSGGVGLQQQLPVNGQTWVPYSSQQRKFSIADYIPSVYLRVERERKWFVQTAFRYGAPQFVKRVTYKRDTLPTSPQSIFKITNARAVKKTYYHEVPLSFNYYPAPGFSIGTGVQWNVFYKAIINSQDTYRNLFTQTDSAGISSIQRLDRDSATVFRKTYWQGTVQTQYQWKQLTFGAQYNFALQPYIDFTITGESRQRVKNNSLQLFIRYQLWKSRKKDK